MNRCIPPGFLVVYIEEENRQISVYRAVTPHHQACHSERSAKHGVEESSHFVYVCSKTGAKILRLGIASLRMTETEDIPTNCNLTFISKRQLVKACTPKMTISRYLTPV